MSFWLQLTAALSAALVSGVMGAALVPFLKKMRFCEPEQSEKSGEAQVKPTMCGLLTAFGLLTGMVLSFTLYKEFGGADRTSMAFAEESRKLWLALGHGLVLAGGGFAVDVLTVRRKLRYRIRPLLLTGAVLLVTIGIFSLQFPVGWYLASVSLVTVLCWSMLRTVEQEADGVTVALNSVQLLFLTILLLRENSPLMALYSLTAAGACLGCMVWNLHPAKCRLGQTGSYLLGSSVPVICIFTEQWRALALCMVFYVLNDLPLLLKQDGKRRTLLGRMEQAAVWKRIAIAVGTAIFCGIMLLV